MIFSVVKIIPTDESKIAKTLNDTPDLLSKHTRLRLLIAPDIGAFSSEVGIGSR